MRATGRPRGAVLVHSGAVLFLCIVYLFLHDAIAQVGTTTRVSVDSRGNQANSGSFIPTVSADGRFVAFASFASNLVPGDTNGVGDTFVHDRQTGQTTRVSVDSSGNETNDSSFDPSLSADGRFVAFTSRASNLAPGDFNEESDIFVHDRETGHTTRVSVDSRGNAANGYSQNPSISADGRFVAFESAASNLEPGNSLASTDVFVHDRQTGQTTRVSVDSRVNKLDVNNELPSISADGRFVAFSSRADETGDVFVYDRQTGRTAHVSIDSSGNQANGESFSPAISAEGRFVAFESRASNLAPGDTNEITDVFVHDRQTGRTTRASVGSNGNGANAFTLQFSMSDDGRFVAFSSRASNLVPSDTNEFFDIFVHDLGAPSARRSCEALFGDAPGFRLCDETASTCSFNATTDGGTCDQMCQSLGSQCVGALDNEGASCHALSGSYDTCQSRRETEICVCERPLTEVLYRLNAGGPRIASVDAGPDWVSDDGFHSGGSRVVTGRTVRGLDSSVQLSTPPEVYETERFSPPNAAVRPPNRWHACGAGEERWPYPHRF